MAEVVDDAVAEADGSGDGGLSMADATGNPDGVSNSATSGLGISITVISASMLSSTQVLNLRVV